MPTKHDVFIGEYKQVACTKCGKDTYQTRMLFDSGKAYHADCWFIKKKNANSAGPASSHRPSEASDAVADASAKNRRYAIIEGNADYALGITCQKFGKKLPQELTEKQIEFATELAHQFYGLQYLEEGDKQ